MTAFTVMTWNVQNLFLHTEEDGPDTEGAFQQKLASLAAVIDHAQPHVLALQEVGSNGALQQLQGALAHAMPHAVEGNPGDRKIRVAFLSTLPIDNVNFLRRFPELVRPVPVKDPIFDKPDTLPDESLTDEMGRGALEITVSLDGTPITVITAHFKSKLISFAREQGLVSGNRFQPNNEGERYRYASYALYLRAAEASSIRHRLNEILGDSNDPDDIAEGTGKDTALVFCGDLNDEVEAATTQIISGPTGSEINTGGFPRGDKGDGFRMWNLAPCCHLSKRAESSSRPTRAYTKVAANSSTTCLPATSWSTPAICQPRAPSCPLTRCRAWATTPTNGATSRVPITRRLWQLLKYKQGFWGAALPCC